VQRQRAIPVNESAAPSERRFGFGENWKSFHARLDDTRIAEAEKSLQWLVGRQRLDGARFLDIGSGSGLSSLAARRLGARVVSFDYDPQSVECTKALRDRFFPGDPDWRVEPGSILDRDYLDALGRFDIVYSWGVLHHTGAMAQAIDNASRLVLPDGMLVVALYRRTPLCRFWAWEKRWYCHASIRAQAVARGLYVMLMRLGFALLGRNFAAYVADYRSKRGMDYIHDVHDWLGGYPYESIGPTEVAEKLMELKFEHVRSKVHPASLGLFGSGCDEYVYRRAELG
jgi:2-polyprenyl-6-hydroxyphenyl methylase/3-demethylubiquinone-9 3-methyltransferase